MCQYTLSIAQTGRERGCEGMEMNGSENEKTAVEKEKGRVKDE